MTDLAYWGSMLIIPAAAVVVALTVFVLARISHARTAADRPAGAHHTTPAE